MTGTGSTGSVLLRVISAMITPAILILATGSLVASTLSRLSRTGDRARALLDRLVELRAAGDSVQAQLYARWLLTYRRRSGLTERALTCFYTAIFLFVASSLAIALDEFTKDRLPWLSLVLVLGGSMLLFAGVAALVLETNMATGQLRHEIDAAFVGGDLNVEAKNGESPHIVRASS